MIKLYYNKGRNYNNCQNKSCYIFLCKTVCFDGQKCTSGLHESVSKKNIEAISFYQKYLLISDSYYAKYDHFHFQCHM